MKNPFLRISILVVSLIAGAQTTPQSATPQQTSAQPSARQQAQPETPVSNANQAAGSADGLHIIPAPRELELGDGKLTLGSTIRIVLNSRHAKEDRMAAEVVAEEIGSITGRKPVIAAAATAPPGTAIYIALAGVGGSGAVNTFRGFVPS